MAKHHKDSINAALRVAEMPLFFITGMAKTGTTWLQLMLNAHPEISCKGETHLPNHLFPAIERLFTEYAELMNHKRDVALPGVPGLAGYTADEIRDTGYLLWAQRLAAIWDGTARAVGDKTPDNLLHLGLIMHYFPQARIIHMTRDPRDTIVSAWFHNIRLDREAFLEVFPTIDSFVGVYADGYRKARQIASDASVTLEGRFHMLSYELLHAETERSLHNLLRFLEVVAEPSHVDRMIRAGRFETLSGGRQAGETDPESFFRHGQPGDWRNHLPQEAADRLIALVAG